MNGQTDCPPHHNFAVTVPPDDFVIGWCCLRISEGDDRIGELMYVLNRGFWGRGYATEAARGVLGYGSRGWSPPHLRNVPAGEHRFMACSGEAWDATRRSLREHVWIRGQWFDSYLYAILEHEWTSGMDAS